jgi:calcineurin-like phosphoesterase
MPRKFDVAEGDVRLSAVLVEFDPATKRATKCELVTVRE